MIACPWGFLSGSVYSPMTFHPARGFFASFCVVSSAHFPPRGWTDPSIMNAEVAVL